MEKDISTAEIKLYVRLPNSWISFRHSLILLLKPNTMHLNDGKNVNEDNNNENETAGRKRIDHKKLGKSNCGLNFTI